MARLSTEGPAIPKKRGRPSLQGKRAGNSPQNDEPSNENPRPRKRGRPSLADKRAEAAEENSAQEGQPKRKRGRPSLTDKRGEDTTEGDAQAPKRKRGRPSLQNVEPAEVQNKPAKPRRAQKDHGTAKPAEGQEKKRRGRPSGGAGSIRRASDIQPEESRRRSNQHAADDDEPPASPPKPYAHIAPRVRRVRQSTIDAKWEPLPPDALAAATSALELAQPPILQRLSSTQQRRAHADTALRLVAHRIARKVQRGLPFPPPVVAGSAAEELDFESVLDGRAAVERQLEPVAHAVELLERERGRMEKELERDYEMLRVLEGRARAQGRETRGLLKKAHVLAPRPKVVKEEDDDDKEMVFGPAGTAAVGNVFKDIGDEELKALATQLGGHVESIRTNLQQAEHVAPELERTRATLRAVLFDHLEPAQYDKVVLG